MTLNDLYWFMISSIANSKIVEKKPNHIWYQTVVKSWADNGFDVIFYVWDQIL